MELISLLIGTVILRPYVFIFLAIFFFIASQQIGWRRTLIWTITAYLVAFAAEYSSIHNGFPFGIYYYVETTLDQELWIAGVPFMDSLSWSFLTFTGYTCAWQLVAAWKGRNGRLDDSAYQAVRRSPVVLFLGALITVWMDPIIDTVALMGDRWFLGQIHGWPNGGEYFGVPLTNFAGWYLVTAVTIGVNQAIDALLNKSDEQTGPARHSVHASGRLRPLRLPRWIQSLHDRLAPGVDSVPRRPALRHQLPADFLAHPSRAGFFAPHLGREHGFVAEGGSRAGPRATDRPVELLMTLEHVFQEDASEEDLPIDRVVPHRVLRIVLYDGSFLENLRLKHEIDMDRPLENLRREEGLHASAD